MPASVAGEMLIAIWIDYHMAFFVALGTSHRYNHEIRHFGLGIVGLGEHPSLVAHGRLFPRVLDHELQVRIREGVAAAVLDLQPLAERVDHQAVTLGRIAVGVMVDLVDVVVGVGVKRTSRSEDNVGVQLSHLVSLV